MDGCVGKRSVDRMVKPRKANGHVLRENMNKKDEKSIYFCSRIGCSAKVTSTKGTQIGSTDNNTKVGRPQIFSPLNGKEIVGSSSRTPGGFGCLRNLDRCTGRRQELSNTDTYSSNTTSFHDDPAAAEHIRPRQKTKRGKINVQSQNTVSREDMMIKAGRSSRGTIRSSHKTIDLGSRDALMGPAGFLVDPLKLSLHTLW